MTRELYNTFIISVDVLREDAEYAQVFDIAPGLYDPDRLQELLQRTIREGNGFHVVGEMPNDH